MSVSIRHDWTTEQIQALLELPLMDLLWQAQTVHREANPGYRVQLASLLSVKTGGCEEDCAYCAQSIHNSSDVSAFEAQMQVEPVLQRARAAKEAGADRFCMGWAWREIRDGAHFEAMLDMVRGVRGMGMEACVTAGMLTDHQAERATAHRRAQRRRLRGVLARAQLQHGRNPAELVRAGQCNAQRECLLFTTVKPGRKTRSEWDSGLPCSTKPPPPPRAPPRCNWRRTTISTSGSRTSRRALLTA